MTNPLLFDRACNTDRVSTGRGYGEIPTQEWLAEGAPSVFGDACESPIEAIMGAAVELIFLMGSHGRTVVEAQKQFGPYRVDFAISGPGRLQPMVIECDGHEFHERTKKQAAHDRQRDRWFAARGIVVLRFTGSEIYNAPFGSAIEAYKCYESTMGAAHG